MENSLDPQGLALGPGSNRLGGLPLGSGSRADAVFPSVGYGTAHPHLGNASALNLFLPH